MTAPPRPSRPTWHDRPPRYDSVGMALWWEMQAHLWHDWAVHTERELESAEAALDRARERPDPDSWRGP